MVPAIIFPSTDNPEHAIGLLWILLFFGAFVLPVLQGIMLQSVESKARASANSLANFAYNLLGNLPSPIAYGYACDNYGGRTSRMGMRVLMSASLVACILISIALTLTCR